MGYLDLDQWNDRRIPIEGGTAPYTVSLVSGDLPTGGALESDGYVEGYGIIPQDGSFTITVTDSSSPAETLTVDVGLDVYESPYSPSYNSPGIPAVIEADDALMPATQWIGPLAVQFHHSGNNTNPIVAELEQLVGEAVSEVVCTIPLLNYPNPGCSGA